MENNYFEDNQVLVPRIFIINANKLMDQLEEQNKELNELRFLRDKLIKQDVSKDLERMISLINGAI